MKDQALGVATCPFPNEYKEAEQPFKKAGRLVGDITKLRVLMFKQQGIDFKPEMYAEGAHGPHGNFDIKLGFRKAPYDIDPVFDMIGSLKTFSLLYVRSDDTVKHPYPHEIFLKEEDLDDLIVLVANKTREVFLATEAKPKLEI